MILYLTIEVSKRLIDPVESTVSGELSGWTQAVGAIFAIVAGFTVTLWQMSRQRGEAKDAEAAAAKAALLLAHDALDAVSERLNAALTPGLRVQDLALRGVRTSELVAAMTAYDLARVPSALLPEFVRLRSYVAAINARLSEIYASETAPDYTQKIRKRAERHTRLATAVKGRNDAAGFYANLQRAAKDKHQVRAFPLTDYAEVLAYK